MAFFTDHTILFYFLIICEWERDAQAFYVSPTVRDSSPLPAKSIVVD